MKKLSLFNLAWPIFVETLLFMLLGSVDIFVLSRYDDLAASSVNTANQAISITTIVFTVISTASAVLISQYLGAKKRENASRVAALSMTFHMIFGVIISAVYVFFAKPILLVSLITWVSHTYAGFPYKSPQIRLAVFLPTPGSLTSSSMVSGTVLLYSSLSIMHISTISAAFVLYSPQLLIISATESTSAEA